jgi:uncharacterized protein
VNGRGSQQPTSIRAIPEIEALDQRDRFVRIPESVDVPLTKRVQQLVDTSAFRRLAKISQLGLVALVYPAANHTRFEHSLGVYRTCLLFLKHLCGDARFVGMVSVHQAEVLICAALLHDVGHWPYCHPIEDLALTGLPEHEDFAERFISDPEIADILRSHWSIEPAEVLEILNGHTDDVAIDLLQSIMSGPIDVDKMDYLYRDSLHAGVPYGRQFDSQRLITSLIVNQDGNGIAITDKGRTAAEMMVFSRYIMFSEVYWHHAVRSATAMLQRIIYELRDSLDFENLFTLDEAAFDQAVLKKCKGTPLEGLASGLFGSRRVLYKRLAQYSNFENEVIYKRLARQPYAALRDCAVRLGAKLENALQTNIPAEDVLIDAPPVGLEVQFDIDVKIKQTGTYHRLDEVSPVIRALATQQFDEYVKRVRVFIHPHWADQCATISDISKLIYEAAFEID